MGCCGCMRRFQDNLLRSLGVMFTYYIIIVLGSMAISLLWFMFDNTITTPKVFLLCSSMWAFGPVYIFAMVGACILTAKGRDHNMDKDSTAAGVSEMLMFTEAFPHEAPVNVPAVVPETVSKSPSHSLPAYDLVVSLPPSYSEVMLNMEQVAADAEPENSISQV